LQKTKHKLNVTLISLIATTECVDSIKNDILPKRYTITQSG